MLLVIDSSVLAKWLFPEPLQSQARAVRQDWESSRAELIAPNLMLVEVGNIIWSNYKMLYVELPQAQAELA